MIYWVSQNLCLILRWLTVVSCWSVCWLHHLAFKCRWTAESSFLFFPWWKGALSKGLSPSRSGTYRLCLYRDNESVNVRVQEEVKEWVPPLLSFCLFSDRVVSIIASVLSAFCIIFVCSSQSVCVRFSGVRKIAWFLLPLHEFGKGKSVVIRKISLTKWSWQCVPCPRTRKNVLSVSPPEASLAHYGIEQACSAFPV